MELAHEIARMVGFDERAGVIARSAHPFTSSPHRGDVRFSTRLTRESPLGNISAVLHELGHALYEQGFPGGAARTAIYDAPSLGAHESQSRFWENQIGHTRAFWEQPRADPAAPLPGRDGRHRRGAAAPGRAGRAALPHPRGGRRGHLQPAHRPALRDRARPACAATSTWTTCPEAFSDGMERLLGIRPPTDALGAMQDIHWADGLFGYFPTYTLGNLYAAQLAEAAERDLGPIEEAVAEGRLADLLGFMRDRVHRHGARFPTPRADAPRDRGRAELGRPGAPPRALLRAGLTPDRPAGAGITPGGGPPPSLPGWSGPPAS